MEKTVDKLTSQYPSLSYELVYSIVAEYYPDIESIDSLLSQLQEQQQQSTVNQQRSWSSIVVFQQQQSSSSSQLSTHQDRDASLIMLIQEFPDADVELMYNLLADNLDCEDAQQGSSSSSSPQVQRSKDAVKTSSQPSSAPTSPAMAQLLSSQSDSLQFSARPQQSLKLKIEDIVRQYYSGNGRVNNFQYAAASWQQSSSRMIENSIKAGKAIRQKQYAVAGYYGDENQKMWDDALRSQVYATLKTVEMQSTEFILDLHHCSVNEAVAIVDFKLNEWFCTHRIPGKLLCAKEFQLVVGRGTHSTSKRSRLKPAVQYYLANNSWKHQLDSSGSTFIISGKTLSR
ncbi:hypothetical protein MP228_001818 [Amoeboaphelidium protococcarum]|nr:hypothetical protein MP228_001818 [Amoeboaphelidium protococcarum]